MITGVTSLAILAAWWPRERPLFVSNNTPSMIRGIYLVTDLEDAPASGQTVVVRIPSSWKAAIKKTGLITDTSQFILKKVVAVPGQTVEVSNGRYFVDGEPVADIEAESVAMFGVSPGERLERERYAVATGYKRGVDSRYFGPVALTDIIGQATLIIPFKGGAQ